MPSIALEIRSYQFKKSTNGSTSVSAALTLSLTNASGFMAFAVILTIASSVRRLESQPTIAPASHWPRSLCSADMVRAAAGEEA